jgi:hypothetical protein
MTGWTPGGGEEDDPAELATSGAPAVRAVEEGLVGGGGGVVELVDDDDVEVVAGEVGEAGGGEALDGGEDVLEARGAAAADLELAEGVVAQGVAEGGE